jgi:hypothetical protein
MAFVTALSSVCPDLVEGFSVAKQKTVSKNQEKICVNLR